MLQIWSECLLTFSGMHGIVTHPQLFAKQASDLREELSSVVPLFNYRKNIEHYRHYVLPCLVTISMLLQVLSLLRLHGHPTEIWLARFRSRKTQLLCCDNSSSKIQLPQTFRT